MNVLDNKSQSLQLFNNSESSADEWFSSCNEGSKIFSPHKWEILGNLKEWTNKDNPDLFKKTKKENFEYIYSRGKELGAGYAGSVLEFTSGNKPKAIKFVAKTVFHQEFNVLSLLYDENQSPIKGIELPPKCVFIEGDQAAKIMTKYDMDLKKLLTNEKPLEKQMARNAILHITQGLATLHAKGIAVADLKLENIFYRKQSEKKGERFDISDFGGSRTAYRIHKESSGNINYETCQILLKTYIKLDLLFYKDIILSVVDKVGSSQFSEEFIKLIDKVPENYSGAQELPQILENMII